MSGVLVGASAAGVFTTLVMLATIHMRRCDEHERWQRWYGVR